MEDSIILSFVRSIQEAKKSKDEYVLEYVKEQGRRTYVTLEEVGIALDIIIEDLTNMILDSHELQEERFKNLVESLDNGTQAKVMTKFDEAEDDLFIRGDKD